MERLSLELITDPVRADAVTVNFEKLVAAISRAEADLDALRAELAALKPSS